jgi:hypothetical protein
MKRLVGVMVLALAVLAAAAQEQQPLNNDAIVKMVKSGLGENLIVTMIQSQPGKYVVTPDEFIRLKQEGVSEKILAAMSNKAGGIVPVNSLPSAPVKIEPNTPIRLSMDDAVSSATAKVGDTFKASVAEDVVINGHLAIAKGAATTGKVLAVKHKQGFAAFDGMVEVQIDSVPAVSGQSVPIVGHMSKGGGSVSIGRGSREVELPKGQIITAHVVQETTIGE